MPGQLFKTSWLFHTILLLMMKGNNCQSGSGSTTNGPNLQGYKGCDLTRCLGLPKSACGGFENCLLSSETVGCSGVTIQALAYEAYIDCLFGPRGFCSLEPLAECYDTHLLKIIKTPLLPPARYRPERFAVFLDSVISDTPGGGGITSVNRLNNAPCPSIPRKNIEDMAECLGANINGVVDLCANAMPVISDLYFPLGYDEPDPRLSHEHLSVRIFEYLNRYVERCYNDELPDIVIPTFGPLRGGTNVIIISTVIVPNILEFGPNSPANCTQLTFRTTYVAKYGVCTSPGRANTGVVRIRNPGRSHEYDDFAYRQNPTITTVENLQTVVSGGTDVIVRGDGFNAVSLAQLIITMTYTFSNTFGSTETIVQRFVGTCSVDSDQEIRCTVPPLVNPKSASSEFVPLYPFKKRRKRSSRGVGGKLSLNFFNDLFSLDNGGKPSELNVKSRHKRALCNSESETGDEESINAADLEYTAEVSLNGEITDFLGDDEMKVYEQPIVKKFEAFPDCRVFRSWRLIKETKLEILGESLGFPLNCDSYTITVGEGRCEIEQLYHDRIICKPPDDQPDLNLDENIHQLEVTVIFPSRSVVEYVGCLEYEDIILDNEIAIYSIIGGLGGLVVIIIIVALCCYCCRKKKVAPEHHRSDNYRNDNYRSDHHRSDHHRSGYQRSEYHRRR